MTSDTFITDIPVSTAQSAYAGISFTPERRAESTRNDYAATLAGDYAELKAITRPDLEPTLENEFARYRDGYRKRYLAYLHSNSRCMSTMITGPSNFPVRRMEKRNEIAHKRLTELVEFRQRALAAIRRELQPWLKPIMSGDSDAADRLKEKIDEAEKLQEQMRAVNAAHKQFLKDPASLDKSTLPDSLKDKIRNYKPQYSWEPHPIAPYQLTNNNANIRRMKERLAQIEQNHAAPTGARGFLLDNLRGGQYRVAVQWFFPGKPDEATRSRLKSNGFRWSPTLGCWQAYRNYHTIELAKIEAGLTRPSAIA